MGHRLDIGDVIDMLEESQMMKRPLTVEAERINFDASPVGETGMAQGLVSIDAEMRRHRHPIEGAAPAKSKGKNAAPLV